MRESSSPPVFRVPTDWRVMGFESKVRWMDLSLPMNWAARWPTRVSLGLEGHVVTCHQVFRRRVESMSAPDTTTEVPFSVVATA